ncbi:HK97-gp10 family putative phage morphogenesis protein [Pseudomonas citronellolis]|uniref:HK97-gp10 family putative phage morphogenesis protein n=1 Tax=Pseudomonas citronellolis TaxID=53408 RepID=UPI0007789A69|nr:HK97-gp10 family putative phage morphogenesis protein [Pseudomonas citronellolis]
MADSVNFEITGLDEVIKKMNDLSVGIRNKAGKRALAKAAAVVRAAARENALGVNDPGTREEIAKNIAIQYMSRRNRLNGDQGYRVGIRGGSRDMSAYGEFGGKGKENPGGDTWYWRFVEFGTERTAAKPFMRPALENNTQKATNAFAAELEKQIDKIIGG